MKLPNHFVSYGKVFLLAFLSLLAAVGIYLVSVLINSVLGFAFGCFILLLAVTVIGLESLYRLANLKKEHRLDDEAQQMILGLYQVLQPRASFPLMRRWAASPDILTLYLNLIITKKPDLVLELGSGVSSLIAGYGVERNGSGRVIALDHDQQFLEQTLNHVKLHKLDHFVELRHAPLVHADSLEEGRLWYSLEAMKDLGKIDLLFIDGPPDPQDKGNRLPALSLLNDRLSENAYVLFDDTVRPSYREGILEWASVNGFRAVEYPYEKGAIVLQR